MDGEQHNLMLSNNAKKETSKANNNYKKNFHITLVGCFKPENQNLTQQDSTHSKHNLTLIKWPALKRW